LRRCCIALALVACEEPRAPEIPVGPTPEGEPLGETEARVTHRIGGRSLEAAEETIDCFSWTLDNDAPLYIQAVDFDNLGSFHHSNWFVVPEDVYPGPDGFWDCSDREFDELAAALSGTVLFAQSTQAWHESQRTNDGFVIKIPQRSKIVADVHLLNLSPSARETEAWMTLELVHPFYVEEVLKPLLLSYLDLRIPASTQSRFTGVCPPFELPTAGAPELHYALPHYHSTGNYFELANDKTIFSTDGFSADAVGVVFDVPQPLEIGGQELRFTCGYNNWNSRDLGWGIGIDEMCVMFGLISGGSIITGVVDNDTEAIDVVDGLHMYEGPCHWVSALAGRAHAEPRVSEKNAPLYVPPVDPEDQGAPGVPACEDADPAAEPLVAPTLENVRAHVFEPWCTFSACHGEAAAAGIDLTTEDLAALASHVVRGDPEASNLYRVISHCTPIGNSGGFVNHMPRNAPVLLEDNLVAIVREWIRTL
jgi:hypothetical protein